MTSVDAVLDALERGPAVVIPLVRQADPRIVKRRPALGEWSIHENAVHLAEVRRRIGGTGARFSLMLAVGLRKESATVSFVAL